MNASPLYQHTTLFNEHQSYDLKQTTNTSIAHLNCTSNNINNENMSSKLVNSKQNSGTPKRRLSYQKMNSPPMSKLPTPGILSSYSTGDLSPFIKRKCLVREKPIKFTQFCYKSIENNTDSPYLIATHNLNSGLSDISGESPKNLNDSFETMQLANLSSGGKLSSRYLTSRRLSKHKSAPLQEQNASPVSKLQHYSTSNGHQPLNDISNHINQKMSLLNPMQNGFKLSEESLMSEEQNDDVTADLENLIFGNSAQVSAQSSNIVNMNYSSMSSINNQNLIKQSLEIDSQCVNLIGDRSKKHILPATVSKKHQDLYCISPETLVNVLNGDYDDQIKETIIVDSRYPYEYEGGHIARALSIYTKERLYEEMFIKRSHHQKQQQQMRDFNNSTMEMEVNESSPPSNKRSIIIFHCEFSSERGPSLLRFLRNSDRTLNEHCYPNLFYPELYLLEGGYKSFYESYKNYCEPQTYKPMLHAEHLYDYKHFRAKAKSWEASKHHIVYKYNEHLKRQKSLSTQKEHEQEADGPQAPKRVIKMKKNY